MEGGSEKGKEGGREGGKGEEREVKGRRGEEGRREKERKGRKAKVYLTHVYLTIVVYMRMLLQQYTYLTSKRLITLPLHHDNTHTPSHDTHQQFHKQTG